MPPLNFRVWDKNGQWMVYGERENYDDMIAWRFRHWEPETDGKEGLPDVVVMQSTGLRDMNGVEVFEGDIVRAYNGVCPIVYYKNGFYLDDGIHSNWDAQDVEVIGNIYENQKCPTCKQFLQHVDDSYGLYCRNPDCWKPRQISLSELNESIEIGSRVWKDVPDAAEHIRQKRDGECSQ